MPFAAELRLRRKTPDGGGLKARSRNGVVDRVDVGFYQRARARRVAVHQLAGLAAAAGELKRFQIRGSHCLQRILNNRFGVLGRRADC